MAKKLTSTKARKILHDKEVHGHPLTEKQRKFFGAIAGGAEPYKAQIGTMLTSLPSNWMDRLSDALAFPQKAVTQLFTGEYQTPSEAMGITNPIGAFATDAILDPFNLFGGAGAAKATKSLIGWKPNPGAYYRMLGKEGLADAIESGVVRANPKRGMFDVPFFSKGEPWDKKYSGPYMAEYTADDVIFPKEELFDVATPRKSISIDNPNLKFYKKDWLRGYKQVKPSRKKQDGGWLDKYDAPQAQNGIEGTMGGLTDVGFNYNGAWGGTMQMGGVLPGAVGFTYARTAGAAPANGPYAKKTKASAQDGEKVMKGREYVEQWMNSPMYKQMLEKSAQGPELERISKGRIAGLNVPTITSTAFDLSGTNTMGTQKHRIRTMLNATVPEREEMIKTLQTAVDNPKNKEAKRKAQEIIQPTITGWDIGLNPILKPGSHDYESVLAHEYGHTTDAPFIGGDLYKMSLEQLKNAKANLQKPYIPESDVEKMRKYQEGKVTTDYGKYVSRPEETRQFLNQVRYLGKTQGVYDPFTQKITPEQYKKIKPLQNTDPMGSLREIYTDEQIIDMLNSISKKQNVSDRVSTAQNGQEMKYYQEGLDFKPKTISQDGVAIDPMGYWNPDNWGKPVTIPSNEITMQGVYEPLIGISDTGDVQYMEPGEDYTFDGEYVTEYPVAQKGIQLASMTNRPGAPSPKSNVPVAKRTNIPTEADSLRVYNAAVALMNYYKNDKRHKAPEINVYDPIIERADIKDLGSKNLDEYRQMYRWLADPDRKSMHEIYKKDYGLTREELLKRVGKAIVESKSAPEGVAYYKDAYPSKIDINAPSAVIDYRIAPQGFMNFFSSVPRDSKKLPMGPEPAGAVTGLYYYDPLAVKPYYMRTPQEKIEWEKKYGNKEKPKPKPTSTPPAKKKVVTPTPEPVKETKAPAPEPVRQTATSPVATAPSFTPPIVPSGSVGVFGPGRSRIGEYDEKTNTFYPDYGNLAARSKANQVDTDLISDEKGLADYVASKTGKKPKIDVTLAKQRNGGVNNADAQPLKKLDQLLNFTNYNKPTKGGWLDKYQ
jgi:hypothetical protein